jgi:hypothetical protein
VWVGDVLVVEPGVPMSRYNATDSALIEYEGNRVIDAAEWEPASAASRAMAARKASTAASQSLIS